MVMYKLSHQTVLLLFCIKRERRKRINNCTFFHKIMQAVRCPSDEMSLTNCVFTSEKEQQFEQWVELHSLVKDVEIIFNLCRQSLLILPSSLSIYRHINVRNLSNSYVFTLKTHASLAPGTVAFSLPQVGVALCCQTMASCSCDVWSSYIITNTLLITARA